MSSGLARATRLRRLVSATAVGVLLALGAASPAFGAASPAFGAAGPAFGAADDESATDRVVTISVTITEYDPCGHDGADCDASGGGDGQLAATGATAMGLLAGAGALLGAVGAAAVVARRRGASRSGA